MIAELMQLVMSAAIAAQAAEIEKSPLTVGFLTWGWVIVIAVTGGVVSFIRKVRDGKARAFNVVELIGEIVTSGFVGVVTFLVCEWGGLNQLLTAAVVGISGHMGSRAIFLGECLLESWVKKRTGVNFPKEPQ